MIWWQKLRNIMNCNVWMCDVMSGPSDADQLHSDERRAGRSAVGRCRQRRETRSGGTQGQYSFLCTHSNGTPKVTGSNLPYATFLSILYNTRSPLYKKFKVLGRNWKNFSCFFLKFRFFFRKLIIIFFAVSHIQKMGQRDLSINWIILEIIVYLFLLWYAW